MGNRFVTGFHREIIISWWHYIFSTYLEHTDLYIFQSKRRTPPRCRNLILHQAAEATPMIGQVQGDYVAPAARDTYFESEPNLVAPFDFDYEPRWCFVENFLCFFSFFLGVADPFMCFLISNRACHNTLMIHVSSMSFQATRDRQETRETQSGKQKCNTKLKNKISLKSRGM